LLFSLSLFLSNHPEPPDISPLSLHDALPISRLALRFDHERCDNRPVGPQFLRLGDLLQICLDGTVADKLYIIEANLKEIAQTKRSEEHTSELQSQSNLVCRLLLEKKKK